MPLTRLNIQMIQGGTDNRNRLADILTGLVENHRDVLTLDLKDQETLSLSLPELLRRAKERAVKDLERD